jgi:hypothetical protein
MDWGSGGGGILRGTDVGAAEEWERLCILGSPSVSSADRDDCEFDFSSGEGASLLLDEAGRAGVDMLGAPESFTGCFGVPKSSFLAGLLGPLRVPVKRDGVPLTEIGLLRVFSGEKMPSSLRMRRLAGLYKIGDRGRLLGLRLGFCGRNWSRGSSRRGPMRGML